MKKHLTELGEHNPYGMLKPQLPRQVPDRPHQSVKKTRKVGKGVLRSLPRDRRTYVCRNLAQIYPPYVFRSEYRQLEQSNIRSKCTDGESVPKATFTACYHRPHCPEAPVSAPCLAITFTLPIPSVPKESRAVAASKPPPLA